MWWGDTGFHEIHVGKEKGLIKGFNHPPQYYRMPEMFQQILHYMNTALTSLFACEACLKIYAYGFRVRNRQQTAAAASCGNQSQYIEVAQGAIFMEQNMIFGMILGPIISNIWGQFFYVFVGKKNYFFFKNTLVSALKVA